MTTLKIGLLEKQKYIFSFELKSEKSNITENNLIHYMYTDPLSNN